MNFRSLTEWEIELIERGLQLLTRHGDSKIARQGAAAMLDQKMPENLLWRDK
jgi:hypothetical protein